MELSVIIPCFNAMDTIEHQLAAFAREEWDRPWELILSDNGRNEGLAEAVQRHGKDIPNVAIVDTSHRPGRSQARNEASRSARGSSLAFTDADDLIERGWVGGMGTALREHAFVACRCDGQRVNPEWIRRSRKDVQYEDVQAYTYPPYLPHAGGSSIGIRRSLFEEMGGFDESWPCLEDTDLCWRVQLAGTPLVFVPDAVVHVRYRSTLEGILRQSLEFGQYNVLLYKTYRAKGMPPLSFSTGLRQWLNLLKSITMVRTRAGCATWLWRFGWCYGRLLGSVKYGVFAL
jgi:GT2 family glycosyltransferase